MRYRLAILTLVACSIAAGGCAPSPTPAPSTRNSTTTQRSLSSDVAQPALSGRPVNGRTEVGIVDAAFQPQTITITAGQVVTWVNKDRVTHAVTADRGGFDMPLLPGSTRTHRFSALGTVAYTCRIHPANPFMHGRVIVS